MSTSARPPLHAVVVHRDKPDEAARCARALLSEETTLTTVTIVDNGSDKASLIRLKALVSDMGEPQRSRCDVVETGKNLGFGPGANVGLRLWLQSLKDSGEQGDRWVAIAPHDALPESGCIERILDAISNRQRAGLVSAEFGPDFDAVPVVDEILGAYWRPAERGEGWVDVDYAHGTLLFARRDMLEEVGLFDERYFAYCEEADLAVRARRCGWEVGMVWGAVVSNSWHGQGPVVDYLQLRNTLLLIHEHFGVKAARARMILAACHSAALFWKRPATAPRMLALHARAVADFKAKRFGPPPEHVLAAQRLRR